MARRFSRRARASAAGCSRTSRRPASTAMRSIRSFIVFARHPDWHGWVDQDPAQDAATRRRVYDMLVADKMPVQAYHHPFPGLSRVEKDGNGYRVVAGM